MNGSIILLFSQLERGLWLSQYNFEFEVHIMLYYCVYWLCSHRHILLLFMYVQCTYYVEYKKPY